MKRPRRSLRPVTPGWCWLVLLAPILLCTPRLHAQQTELHEGKAALRAQQFEFSRELRFAQYLQDKDAGAEAIYVLERVDTASLSRVQKDSLFFMLGWAAYTAKRLDTSVNSLLKVSPSFPLYSKARFFSAYCEAFLGRTDTAAFLLQNHRVSGADTALDELRNLQLAGIDLLKRDYPAYTERERQFTYSSYIDSKEEQRMKIYYDKMRGFRRRSPVLAGIYSALVPGLGKFYAGKKKQGIAAFLPVLSLAALTYEAYRKDGVRSARFIGFGTLFSVFYIGNIWGSTLAVKIRRNEFYKEYDNKILFDMHIPLRNFFN
jgi:hypothetical protein